MATRLGLGCSLSFGGMLKLSGAQLLLGFLGDTNGLAIDFATDQSIKITDAGTPANNTTSSGTVSAGALVGPGSKLTYTSPSPKLTLQSTGYYGYQAHNLYLNSASPANQSVTVISGRQYAITITGTVSITWSSAYVGTTNTPGTTIFTAASGTLTGSGTVQVYNYPAVTDYVATTGSALYSLPYEYNTSAVCQGIRVEPAATNLLTYSNTFSNAAWSKQNMTCSDGQTTGPDGTTSGTLITATASATVQIYQAPTYTAAAWTNSIFVKAGTSAFVWLNTTDGAGDHITWFNLSTFAVAFNGSGNTSVITSVGNGWYRISVTRTTTAGAGFYTFGLSDADNNVACTTGRTVYTYAAGCELGSVSTSPILTGSATVTRAADDLSLATTLWPWDTTANTAYECHADPATISTSIRAFTLSGGGYQIGSSFVFTGSFNVNDTTPSTLKNAVAMKTNDYAVVNGGGAPATGTGTFDGSNVTTLQLGNYNGSNFLNGHLKQILILPRRASNGELQTLTI
jgi:hypothetical protein